MAFVVDARKVEDSVKFCCKVVAAEDRVVVADFEDRALESAAVDVVATAVEDAVVGVMVNETDVEDVDDIEFDVSDKVDGLKPIMRKARKLMLEEKTLRYLINNCSIACTGVMKL